MCEESTESSERMRTKVEVLFTWCDRQGESNRVFFVL